MGGAWGPAVGGAQSRHRAKTRGPSFGDAEISDAFVHILLFCGDPLLFQRIMWFKLLVLILFRKEESYTHEGRKQFPASRSLTANSVGKSQWKV